MILGHERLNSPLGVVDEHSFRAFRESPHQLVKGFALFSTAFHRVDGQEIVTQNCIMANTWVVHNVRRLDSRLAEDSALGWQVVYKYREMVLYCGHRPTQPQP